MAPDAEPRSFTLLELARLLGTTNPTPGLDALLAAAGDAPAGQLTDIDDDLADPFQQGQAAYLAMAESVQRALTVIDRWLP